MVCKSTNLPTRHFLGLQRKHRSKWNNANKLRLEQTLYSNGQLLCHVTLTLWWGEEVEKGVVGDRFGDRPDRATALVLLFLFDCFQCDVLALCPFNRAAVVKNKEQWKQGQEAAFEVSNLKKHLGCTNYPVRTFNYPLPLWLESNTGGHQCSPTTSKLIRVNTS